MNREIKFRAWIDGTMVYGVIPMEANQILKILVKDGVFPTDRWKAERIKHPVMQFTGLHDKNGKDLDWWENDLFDVLGTIRQIVLEDGCFWFKAVDKTATQQRLICFTTMCATNIFPKKIGDIHSNPELLGEQ